jgi:hypothetical protein
MATPTDAEIASIAAEYSLPPALLLGIVHQEGASAGFGLTDATLGAYNLSITQLQSDPLMALTVAARTLAQTFQQTGSWDSALSVYLTGNADAWQSPTSPIGGKVTAILGSAALNPSFGLSRSFTPSDAKLFSSGSTSFAKQLEQMSTSGGITQQTVTSYQQAAAQISTQPFVASANMQQVAADILTAAKLPVTDANVAVIDTMAKGEGMPLGDFNWLATTQGQGKDINSVGVKAFGTYQEGIDATAATLLNGNYGSLVGLMGQGVDLKTIASNPGVQANLRTWQGGSNEDVGLLGGLANVPGTAPSATAKAAPKTANLTAQMVPNPAAVGEFAQQLQAANIDPQEFTANFPNLAAVRRQLLSAKRTSVSDYADVSNALQAQGQGVSQAGIVATVRGQPHPNYPNVTAGAFADTFGTAMLHSVMHTRQVPTNGEVARLVGLDNKEISTYYQQKAAAKSPAAQPQSSAGKIAQLGRTS